MKESVEVACPLCGAMNECWACSGYDYPQERDNSPAFTCQADVIEDNKRLKEQLRLLRLERAELGEACTRAENTWKAWKEEADRKQERIDATIIQALRYESRHNLDPERDQIWGEIKMALMVDAVENK